MATTTPNIHDALVKAGVDEDAATAMAERLTRRDGPSPMSILTGTTIIGFIVLALGLTWLKHDLRELRTEIVANRDRIDGVGTRLSGEIQSLSERLTRIETLLEERLPARR